MEGRAPAQTDNYDRAQPGMLDLQAPGQSKGERGRPWPDPSMCAELGPQRLCPRAVAASRTRLSVRGVMGSRDSRTPAVLDLRTPGQSQGQWGQSWHGPSMCAELGPQRLCPRAVAASGTRLSVRGVVRSRDSSTPAVLDLRTPGQSQGEWGQSWQGPSMCAQLGLQQLCRRAVQAGWAGGPPPTSMGPAGRPLP